MFIYNFFAVLAFAVSILALIYAFRKSGVPTIHGLVLPVILLLISRIGAQILFNLEHLEWRNYFTNFFSLTRGGLSLWGGFYLCILVVVVYALIFRIPVLLFLDAVSPAAVLALGVGRLGCLFAGCCRGFPLPPHLMLPKFVPRPELFPTPLIASMGNFLLAFLLFRTPINRARYGQRTAFFFISYGLLRFFTGFLRTNTNIIAGLKMMQLLIIPAIVIGIALLSRKKYVTHHKYISKRITL